MTPRDFGVTVTTRSADVGADQHWEETRFGAKDVYYQVVTEQEREERLRAQSRVKKRGVTVRSIKNPHYVDLTPAEVADRLRERQDGDFLFSPEVCMRYVRMYQHAALSPAVAKHRFDTSHIAIYIVHHLMMHPPCRASRASS